MFGFFKKDKYEQEAQAAMERRARQAAPRLAAKVEPQAAESREQAIRRMQEHVAPMVSPERQALLKNAMAVHRAKKKILDDLDDESRAKLVAMAITTLLRQIEPDADTPRKK